MTHVHERAHTHPLHVGLGKIWASREDSLPYIVANIDHGSVQTREYQSMALLSPAKKSRCRAGTQESNIQLESEYILKQSL